MSQVRTRSAIALILALGGMSGLARAADTEAAASDIKLVADNMFGGRNMQLAAADGAASEAPGGEKAKAGDDATATPSLWGDGGSGGTLSTHLGADSAVGVSQQAASTGYELGGIGVGGGGSAAEGGMMTAPTKGRPIRFDNGVFLYPAIMLGYGRNDNVRGTSTNKVASDFWVLNPEAVAEMRTRGDRYTLSYSGNYASYTSSSSDSYDQHELWAAGDNFFTARARLGWGVGYLQRIDPRGATDRPTSSEPDRWHAPVLRALGIYGAPGAIGRIELEGSRMNKRYENNRDYTELSDVDLTTVSGRFFYRVMPKTSLLLELRNTWAEYVSSLSTMDNSDRRYYVGAEWDFLAKTKGTIKLGRGYKEFESSTRKDGNRNSWEAGIQWAPLTYSVFDFQSSRTFQDSTGLGDYLVNTSNTVSWNHKWASYISSRVNYGVTKSDYSATSRNDNLKRYSVGFFTELGYRARLGLDWSHTKRESSLDTYDFERDVLMLTLEGIL